jgi:two-component system phosphate regulon sensor histidine kinase PhoR
MKKRDSLLFHILVFTLAQIAWFSLLALWIYWYVSNYIILTEVGDKLSPQIISESTNVMTLIGGLVLLVAVSVGMSLIFIYLTRQINITKMYDTFIANITHELKSPLSSIQLSLETMLKRDVPEKKQKEFLLLINKDIERLNGLINTILNIAGLEQKKHVYDYQLYPAQDIVETLISESVAEFNIAQDTITLEGKTDCNCAIDKRTFKMALNNLFDNAIKYSIKPIKIKIRFSQNIKNFIISFSDNGIGIPFWGQKRIFNKFQRIYDPESPNVKGTGLGLYWVKEIIKTHGGNISVFSRGRNQGTTFKIEIPTYPSARKRYIDKLLKVTQTYHKRISGYHV